jgi:hypothetical protein
VPLVMAVLIAALGETIDMYDDVIFRGYWKWSASLHDFINTLLWPSAIFLLARYTMLFDPTRRNR